MIYAKATGLTGATIVRAYPDGTPGDKINGARISSKSNEARRALRKLRATGGDRHQYAQVTLRD